MSVPCETSSFDFLDVDAQSSHLSQARAACEGCPILLACRKDALSTSMAGFAGGMTEQEREAWQARNGTPEGTLDVIDVTPAWDITPRITDILPVMESGLHSSVRDLILRMTAAGMPAETIADRLNHPHVKPETVDYVRRTYMKTYALADGSTP